MIELTKIPAVLVEYLKNLGPTKNVPEESVEGNSTNQSMRRQARRYGSIPL